VDPSQVDSETVFQEFLAEVQALDDFRTEYGHRYDFEGLGRDDQDVQRLIEAMAFYRARTKATVDHALREYKLRALEQLFPYLLSPMPAMAITAPNLASNMTETRELPRHAEVTLTPLDNQPSETHPRVFRTERRLPIFPLRIIEHSVELIRRPAAASASNRATIPTGAPHSLLRLEVAPSPTGDRSKRYFDDPACSLHELRLHVNPLGDALTALRLFDAMQLACKAAVVSVYAEGVKRHEAGPVRPRFGANLDDAEGTFDNPIESVRRAVHFPLEHFSITVPLSGIPAEWTRMTLDFQLDEQWPEGLSASDQSFVLNCVALENLVARSAEPALLDGTALGFRLQPPEQTQHWKVREVLGVYATDPKASSGRRALIPRALSEEGYSVIVKGNGAEREVWIEPEAVRGVVDAPETLYVEAEWFDPDPTLPNPRASAVRVNDHDLGTLSFHLLDPPRPCCESPLRTDTALLERLLALQGVPPRSAHDLKALLTILGVDTSDIFGRIPRYIESVQTGVVPDMHGPTGTIRNYEITLKNVPPVLHPAVRLLFSHLPRFLAAWAGDAETRLSLSFDPATVKQPLAYTWRSVGDA
jgi:type VI secretion system protein ImpG